MKSDRLIYIENSNDIHPYIKYGGKDKPNEINVPYLTEEINEKLLKQATTFNTNDETSHYKSYVISSKTGETVWGIKLGSYGTSFKNMELVFDNPVIKEFIGDVYGKNKIVNYLNKEYFETNPDYRVFDVEKDLLVNFIGSFKKICYNKKNELVWGIMIKNDESDEQLYFVQTEKLPCLSNERQMKLLSVFDNF